MNSDLAFQLLGSAGFLGLLGVIVNALANRKRVSARTTDIITRAAAGVVERLEGEIARKASTIAALETREDELEKRIEALEKSQDDYREVAQNHVAWDFQVRGVLAAHGIDVEPPPPILPRQL